MLLFPYFVTINIFDTTPIVQIPTFTLHVTHSIFLINIFYPTKNLRLGHVPPPLLPRSPPNIHYGKEGAKELRGDGQAPPWAWPGLALGLLYSP
jgi:hypothetical protein